jgi:hypothetical protein
VIGDGLCDNVVDGVNTPGGLTDGVDVSVVVVGEVDVPVVVVGGGVVVTVVVVVDSTRRRRTKHLFL